MSEKISQPVDDVVADEGTMPKYGLMRFSTAAGDWGLMFSHIRDFVGGAHRNGWREKDLRRVCKVQLFFDAYVTPLGPRRVICGEGYAVCNPADIYRKEEARATAMADLTTNLIRMGVSVDFVASVESCYFDRPRHPKKEQPPKVTLAELAKSTEIVLAEVDAFVANLDAALEKRKAQKLKDEAALRVLAAQRKIAETILPEIQADLDFLGAGILILSSTPEILGETRAAFSEAAAFHKKTLYI